MLCRISFWPGKWWPAPLYCLVGAAEMMWNVASHLNMFAGFKWLSHLSHLHCDLNSAGENVFSLAPNSRKPHIDSKLGAHIGFILPVSFEYFPWCIAEGERWEPTLYSLVAHMTTADQRGHRSSSCRGGNGSTLFPSTGHQCLHHLHHLKPAHLHSGHVLKQTTGKKGDQWRWDSNSGGRVDTAVEKEEDGL